MKKFLYLLFIPFILGFFSCSDDSNPQMSFSKTAYILPSEEPLEITLTCTEPVKSSVAVGLAISGTAINDEDYVLSSNEFVFLAGETSAKITITPKNNFDENKTIILAIKNLAGYDFGTNISTTIGVQSKEKLIYSFNTDNYDMPDTLEVAVKIKGMNKKFIHLEDVHIPFTISDKSTAVKGVHYEVVGGVNEFVIPKGDDKAIIKLAFLSKEEGKDKLVLEFGELSKRFIPGNYIEANINIQGHLSESNLVGKWVFNSFSNYDYYDWGWGFNDDKLASLPKSSTADTLEFVAGNEDNYMIKPHMTGDLKNYFKDCELSFARELVDHLSEESGYPEAILSMMEMSVANVAFSATQENLRKAQIGFRIIEGGEILEITINDYEPVDFLVEEFGYMKGENPILKEMPLRFHFKRVK